MSRKMIFSALAGFVFSFSLPTTTFAQEGKWTKKSDISTAKYSHSTSVVNGKIYVIGGRAGSERFSTVEQYDPATDTWTRKADMPSKRSGLSTSVVNGKIYAIGGVVEKPSAIVEEYNPATDTWRRRTDLPSARFDLSSSVVNGKIYAIGGSHRGGIGLGPTTVEEYDPPSDTWRARTDMPTGRGDLSTSVVDGKIYAIGGSPDDGAFISTVEAYDPATDTWTSKSDIMITARAFFCTNVVNGRIYAIGGRSDLWPAVTSANEEYQPIPWGFAWGPNPADGTIHSDTWITLNWYQGDFAASHNMYLGENFDEVNDGLGDTFRGNQILTFLAAGFTGSPYPNGLVRGQKYYWRVDEVNQEEPDSPWKGSVWNFMIQPKTAYAPNPADGAELVDMDINLSWNAGLEAATHTVYFGDNYDDVNNSAGGLSQVVTTYTPGPLEAGKTYYWRIDELGGGRSSGMYKGDIWSFTTRGAAGNPNPSNYSPSVEMNATLSWAPADFSASHHVYFGTDKEAVRNADIVSPEYKGSRLLGAETYDPGILSPDQTYYWRIDEINDTHPDSPWPGSIWSFTTSDFFVIDDFEDYNTGSNEIWWTWNDGTGYFNHPTEPRYAGNGTGSRVGDETTGTTAGDFRIHGGRQSMPFLYDNNKMGVLQYSEATMKLTSPRDWTENGVSILSIWCVAADWDFTGDISPNDVEPMYVVLNDSAVVYHNNPEILKTYGFWTEWRIDLQEFADQGVDLTNIHTFGLGFGDRDNPQAGGKGLMAFDDIRLCR